MIYLADAGNAASLALPKSDDVLLLHGPLAAIVLDYVFLIVIWRTLPCTNEHHVLDAIELFVKGAFNHRVVQSVIDHHTPAGFGL